MMEIPAGKDCRECPFLHWSSVVDEYECTNECDGVDMDYPDHGLRSAACLSAYPNGAVITITAREADK